MLDCLSCSCWDSLLDEEQAPGLRKENCLTEPSVVWFCADLRPKAPLVSLPLPFSCCFESDDYVSKRGGPLLYGLLGSAWFYCFCYIC